MATDTDGLMVWPAVVLLGCWTYASLFEEAGDTVTDSPVPLVWVPSLTTMLAVSALYRVITPFLPEDTLDTPFVKLIEVELPNVTPELLLLLVTLGLFPPIEFAPEKVRLWPPV